MFAVYNSIFALNALMHASFLVVDREKGNDDGASTTI